MDFNAQDETQAPPTVVDARERTSRTAWWLLALVAIAAVVVALREPIVAWLAPRVDALVSALSADTYERAATDPGVSPGQAASDLRGDARPSRTVWADETPSTPAAVRAPVEARPAPAPLPEIRPLYPVPTAPPAPAVPEGEAGLVEALRAGTLRPATDADIARWKSRYRSTHGRMPDRGFEDHLRMMEAYVIKDDFVIPGGLHGAHAVVFLLDDGVPYPRGDAGHSVILDLASGACVGMTCGMLLRD